MTTLSYQRQQVTPRPGGRAAADRRNAVKNRLEYATAGTAALAPKRRPVTEPERTSRAAADRSGSAASHGSGPRTVADPAPRLRVAPPAPVTAPRAPFVTLVLLLVASGVLGILVLNTKINENAFRLNDLQQRQSTLDQRQQALTQDLNQQESPNSLAAAARRLGLVPGEPAYLRLPDGKVLGVPRPASSQASASGTQTDAGDDPLNLAVQPGR